jgi:uncharacterized protein YjbJ (UPF0337 family)
MTEGRGEKPTNEEPEAATVRETKGSVHEAIGKLIGDDAARERGAAEKQAGASKAEGTAKR